jgi:hypothetical protein
MNSYDIEKLLAACPEAAHKFHETGADDVMSCFNIANILHTKGQLYPASMMYRRAFDLHSKSPSQFPLAHGLLQVTLLCLVKAGLPVPSEDIELLRRICTPFADYIIGAIQVFAPAPNYLKALQSFRNCFEEFHTGEECDSIYLTAAARYFDSAATGVVAPHGHLSMPQAQLIPRRLFFFWDKNPPREITENFEYHNSFNSFDVEVFDVGRGAEFLYNYFGVEAREMFLNTRHPAEAADILRAHVIYTYGGYWLDADMRIRTIEKFDEVMPRNFEAIFPVTPTYVVHNDFFGAVPNNPIIGDTVLSITRNCYLHKGLYIAYKTGPGVFKRALNRAYYKALTGRGPIPNAKILPQEVFDYALESYEVSYKHGAGSWHNA